jgi:hypothetical protein
MVKSAGFDFKILASLPGADGRAVFIEKSNYLMRVTRVIDY